MNMPSHLRHCRQFQARYPKRGPDGKPILVTFWLEERAANQFLYMCQRFHEKYGAGVFLQITDAGRTHAQQAHLKALKPRLAATPGRSYHEAGLAIDVAMGAVNTITGSDEATEDFLNLHGFYRTVSYEDWHFEYHIDRPRGHVRDDIAYIHNAR